MAVRRTNCYEQALACDYFDKFCNANSLGDILLNYHQICKICSLTATNFQEFYPKIKAKIPSWRAGELWAKLDKRSSQKCYGWGKLCSETRVLVIGGGPCGLRAAIEAQLLGAKTVLIEKRENFSRNNVLHLWPFTITDLRNLGAKLFYGKFCAGSIDHISIRQLQCILLKIALIVGVEFHEGVSFENLVEPKSETDLGWRASVSPREHPVSHFHFDVVIGADGRRCTLPGFQRKALRAKLAIAITANFIHNHTEAEAKVQEISGVSYIFKQQFFQELEDAMGIALENIVFYKDETHYFVMTPTKQSLLDKGVLYQDFSDPELLLSPENVDPEALQLFTMQAVVFATDNRLSLQFAANSRGEPDVALFDFTTMYASENSCRAIERNGHKLLMGLVGDSLLEPFWPTGSGIARGFLAAFDIAWMIRSWGKGLKSVYEVLAERESIHRILAQTTNENLNKDHNQYSIDPTTRYPKINVAALGAYQVRSLFDSDEDIKDVFLSIRESKRCRLVPQIVILKWFKDQLFEVGVKVTSLLELFTNGECLIAIVSRYRPELIEFHTEPRSPVQNNRCAYDILFEEYNIPIPKFADAEFSSELTAADAPQLVQYLSQIYNVFKGEIPKNKEDYCPPDTSERRYKDSSQIVYPNNNNSAFHHNLAIKHFLKAKEQLQERKANEETQSKRERRRSQFYESIMQTESNFNQQRSTSSVNIPVVKLNPVPPGELFSACRNGSDREKNVKPSDSRNGTNVTSKLIRSRSDVGFRSKPPSAYQNQNCSELEKIQLKIRKSKVTPLGDIVSTFLGKHINQNSACLSNEESDENPLSSERRHLKPARPRSTYQNVNDQHSDSFYQIEDHENAQQEPSSTNPFFNSSPEQDTSFKERCNFLEKNLYNSGRDLKVHIGTAWFENAESKKNHPNSNPPTTGTHPLQKSQSSVFGTGFHPLKRGSSFNVRTKMEKSFNNTKMEAAREQKEFNPKALFLERRLGEMVERHHVPLQWRSDEKSQSSQPKTDHNRIHHNCFHHQQKPFQHGVCNSSGSGIVPSLDGEKPNLNNKGKWQKEKKFNPASSGTDSDLDCFLNAIDFTSIDGQDLQELLSSY